MTARDDQLFYDGTCGLCHAAVRFILNRGDRGLAFRFAPLQGETFLQRVPGPERTGLRESLVVLTGDGQVLERSQAVLHILHRFGGGWRWLGRLGRSVPRALADALYDWIARIRHRIFKQPVELCPRMNPGQRSRFDP